MIKKFSLVLAVLILIVTVGCSFGKSTGTTTPAANVRQVRQAELSGKWAVKQLEINLESSISIMLTLAEGDMVEGYYYMEKGNGLTFQISGVSLIYESQPADAKSAVTSDRFSFTASSGQGKAYTLKLTPAKGSTTEKAAATVFLEIVYPATGEVFVPMGTK
jgi:hypothetical protein